MRLSARHLVLGCLLASAACVRLLPVYNPPPISFRPLAPDIVESAIFAGMAKCRWLPTRQGPGVLDGTLHLRSHTAVVRVTYTSSEYTLRYLSSTKLRYKRRDDGTEWIHKNYNGWINRLVAAINAELGEAGQRHSAPAPKQDAAQPASVH